MKKSFLVSVCGALGLITISPALASTVTTEFGRPLLVEGIATDPTCNDTALRVETEVQGWHDALASKRADNLLVDVRWNDALARDLVQERYASLSPAASDTGCPLTN
jgi:hypothetical protein